MGTQSRPSGGSRLKSAAVQRRMGARSWCSMAQTSHTPQVTDFGLSFAARFPVLVSDLATTNGSDPCFLRYQNLGPASVKLFLREEQSFDLEMDHPTEKVSVLVAK